METQNYQLALLGHQIVDIDLPDAELEYRPQFIRNTEAWTLYERILAETVWQQETIKVYGKEHLTPRLSCWMGDPSADYGYSNLMMKPVPWSNTVLSVKRHLALATGDSFNSVLINYYRNGQDSNGWHSDDEPQLGQNPVIASISLGATRDFHLRHKTEKQHNHKMALENGSLLMMRGSTQRYWQHHIPKRARAAGRINLTFRTIVS